MSDDHLSNEISVSAELTPTGVKAAAKSRILSAIDRVVGGAIDRFTPKLEGPAALARSNNVREVRINDALTDKMVEMIHADPALAERALERHLGSIGRRQENKEAVISLALEDLSQSPPNEDQNNAGPEALDDGFLNRFERVAEDATSDQLRERWARVLAAEIRQPGTFSAKVMRVVDEMDPTTASLFETTCKSRVGDALPKCLLPSLSFNELARLVTAGLLLDAATGGQLRVSTVGADNLGNPLHFLPFGDQVLGVSGQNPLPSLAYSDAAPVLVDKGNPRVPIYLLTDAGHAISSILENEEEAAFTRLVEQVATALPDVELRTYVKLTAGGYRLSNVVAKKEL